VNAVKQRRLRGLAVSELGFGGASLGNLYQETSDADARLAVDAAWAGGVRYFDTAPHYGLGLSERRLGTAFATRPGRDYVLSTKVGRLLVPNPAPTGSDLAAGGFAVPDTTVRRFDFSRDGVLRSLESSLDRLAAPVLRHPADGEHRQLLHLHGDRRVQHVHGHELALAGPLAVQQRGERALERAVGGDRVDRVGAGRRGRVAARPAENIAPLIAWSSRSWPGRLA
jgi:Aldo/keto reductase family